MARRIVIGTLVILVIAALGVWRWRQSSLPVTPSSSGSSGSSGERVRPAGCNPLPATPKLPAALAPASPTIDGVIQALDGSLDPSHKAFLRCFPEEDELIARTHFGMGRWLRGALHLYSRNALTAHLRTGGAKNPDDMSAMIVRAYARSLRGVPIAAGVTK